MTLDLTKQSDPIYKQKVGMIKSFVEPTFVSILKIF